jgi:hypothetical protein
MLSLKMEIRNNRHIVVAHSTCNGIILTIVAAIYMINYLLDILLYFYQQTSLLIQ